MRSDHGSILAVAAAAMLALPLAAAATPFPGPDGFGYTGVEIPFNLRDVSATGTLLTLADDDFSAAIDIPFTFTFYGTGYTQLRVVSDGVVTLGNAAIFAFGGGPLPKDDRANNLIAGFWNDLNPRDGGAIGYQTLGSAPNREFVVGYYAVQQNDFPRHVTFETILHEGSDAIELQYGSAPALGFPTSVGIEDATGTNGLQVAFGPDVSFDHQGFLIALDGDGDGFPDPVDACVNSSLSATAVIDGCDSRVANALDATGCTIADAVGECAAGAKNHGKFVSCVAHLTNGLKDAGTISGREKGAIQRCAAQADLP